MNRLRLLIVALAVLPSLAVGQIQIMETGLVLEPPIPQEPLLLDELIPATAFELNRQRGGFTAPGNIQIDIGFESVVLIDGILQSRTRLAISDLTSMVLDPKSASGSNVSTSLPTNAMDLPLNTLIQNTLDHKTIQSIQILDIQLGNVGSLNSAPLQQVLNLQLIQSLH